MSDHIKPSLRVTKDYSVFIQSKDNRPVNMQGQKARALESSMQKNGYVPAYPIHCRKAGTKLEIRDGQHRYGAAMKLGLPVWYVVCEDDIDVAELQQGQTPWSMLDYAKCFSAQGKEPYAELLEFIATHQVPVGMAASLLSGAASFTNIRRTYINGDLRVKSRERAHTIASLFKFLVGLSSRMNNARLLQAIYACSHVAEFDAQRVREGAGRCAEKLIAYSTSDAYMTMLEDLHNFGRKQRVPIKIPAQDAMRARNPTLRNNAA